MSATMEQIKPEQVRAAVPQLFKKLSKEQVADFCELARDFGSTRDPEILETMVELLCPESLGPIIYNAGVTMEEARLLDEYQQKIGAQIKKHRLDRKWTQGDLEEHSGLKQSHISRLELGVHSPSDLTIRKLAEAFEIEPDQLDPGLE